MSAVAYEPTLLIHWDREDDFVSFVLGLCEVMIAHNLRQIRRGVGDPYASDFQYVFEDSGNDAWKDAYHAKASGTGDCKDIVCWRVASLRAQGILARPVALSQGERGGQPFIHVVVQHPNGKIEDPSILFGMSLRSARP